MQHIDLYFYVLYVCQVDQGVFRFLGYYFHFLIWATGCFICLCTISAPEASVVVFKRQLNQNHNAALLSSSALVSEKLQCFKTVTSQTKANGCNIFSVPLCWAAMLIQLTAVAALLPRDGGRRRRVIFFFFFLRSWGPGLTVRQQTQREQKRRKPLSRPLKHCERRESECR